MATPEQQQLIALTTIMFNAPPGAEYLPELEAQLEAGQSIADIAVGLSQTPLFNSQFSGMDSDKAKIDLVLSAVGIDESSSAYEEAFGFFQNSLTNGNSPGLALQEAANFLSDTNDETFNNAAAMFNNKVETGVTHSVELDLSSESLSELKEAIASVTADPQSVAAATQALNQQAEGEQEESSGGGGGFSTPSFTLAAAVTADDSAGLPTIYNVSDITDSAPGPLSVQKARIVTEAANYDNETYRIADGSSAILGADQTLIAEAGSVALTAAETVTGTVENAATLVGRLTDAADLTLNIEDDSTAILGADQTLIAEAGSVALTAAETVTGTVENAATLFGRLTDTANLTLNIEDTAATIEAVEAPYTVLDGATEITAQTDAEPPAAERVTLNVDQATTFGAALTGDYRIEDSAATIQAVIDANDPDGVLANASEITTNDDPIPLSLDLTVAQEATFNVMANYNIVDTAELLLANGAAEPITSATAVTVKDGAAGALSFQQHADLTSLTTDDTWTYSIEGTLDAILSENADGSSVLAGANTITAQDVDGGKALTLTGLTDTSAGTAVDFTDDMVTLTQAQLVAISNAVSVSDADALTVTGVTVTDGNFTEAAAIDLLDANDTITFDGNAAELDLVNFDRVFSTAGVASTANDTITVNGTENADTIDASSQDANFVLNGLGGNNVLIGGNGDDIINGGDGDDIITGGAGADTLTGGAGINTFVYDDASESNASTTDVITDFKGGTGNDTIQFRDIEFLNLMDRSNLSDLGLPEYTNASLAEAVEFGFSQAYFGGGNDDELEALLFNYDGKAYVAIEATAAGNENGALVVTGVTGADADASGAVADNFTAA